MKNQAGWLTLCVYAIFAPKILISFPFNKISRPHILYAANAATPAIPAAWLAGRLAGWLAGRRAPSVYAIFAPMAG